MANFDLARTRGILVAKLDEIGDFVLSTAFLRGLRASAPNARIVLVSSHSSANIAETCPHVDAVLYAARQANGAWGVHGVTEKDETTFTTLRRQGIDLAVVPRFDIDYYSAGQLARSSGARRVAGFSETVTPLKSQENRGYDASFYTDVVQTPQGLHEVEQNLRLLEFLGGSRRGDALEIHSTVADSKDATELVNDAKRHLGVDTVITIAPGCRERVREYPAEKLARVAVGVASRRRAGMIILGGPREREVCAKLGSHFPTLATNLCGQTTLRVASEIIRQSDVLLTMCSGLGHVAAATKTPVAVFSSHPLGGDPTYFHAPERFHPWAPDGKVVVLRPNAVAPCRTRCLAQEAHCITAIDEADSIGTICGLLST